MCNWCSGASENEYRSCSDCMDKAEPYLYRPVLADGGPFISLDVNGPTDTFLVREWCL